MRSSGSETGPVPTKSSQSPLRIRSVQFEGVPPLLALPRVLSGSMMWHNTTDLAVTPLELEVMLRHLVIRTPLHLGYVLLVYWHTSLTEGRSARDLTQAAPSKKKSSCTGIPTGTRNQDGSRYAPAGCLCYGYLSVQIKHHHQCAPWHWGYP